MGASLLENSYWSAKCFLLVKLTCTKVPEDDVKWSCMLCLGCMLALVFQTQTLIPKHAFDFSKPNIPLSKLNLFCPLKLCIQHCFCGISMFWTKVQPCTFSLRLKHSDVGGKMCFLHIFGAAAWTVWNLVGVHCFLYKLLLQFHTWWIWNAISWRWTFRVTNGRVSGKPILGRDCKQVIGELLPVNLLERHYMWNIGELLPGQLIGDALQVNYWRTIANELIGEALQVNYWRAIASQLLERHCNWDIANFWQVNYWRSTAGNPLRDCNVSIGQIFHFTCSKDTVGQHWGIYCCSNAVQLCNGSW